MSQNKVYITHEEMDEVETLFYYKLKSVSEIIEITGFKTDKVDRIIDNIIGRRRLERIEPPPPPPPEKNEFENAFFNTHKNSDFVLITKDPKVLQAREKLT